MDDMTFDMFEKFVGGMSLRAIARQYNISYSTVRRRIMLLEGYQEMAERNRLLNQARAMQHSTNARIRGRGNAIVAQHFISDAGLDRIQLAIAPTPNGRGSSAGVTRETIQRAAAFERRSALQKRQEVYNVVATMLPFVNKYFNANNIAQSEENYIVAFSSLDEYFRTYLTHDEATIFAILEGNTYV